MEELWAVQPDSSRWCRICNDSCRAQSPQWSSHGGGGFGVVGRWTGRHQHGARTGSRSLCWGGTNFLRYLLRSAFGHVVAGGRGPVKTCNHPLGFPCVPLTSDVDVEVETPTVGKARDNSPMEFGKVREQEGGLFCTHKQKKILFDSKRAKLEPK